MQDPQGNRICSHRLKIFHLEGIWRCLTSLLLIFEEVMIVGFLLLLFFFNLLVCFIMKNFEHLEHNHEPTTVMEEILSFYPIYLEKQNEIVQLKSFPRINTCSLGHFCLCISTTFPEKTLSPDFLCKWPRSIASNLSCQHFHCLMYSVHLLSSVCSLRLHVCSIRAGTWLCSH